MTKLTVTRLTVTLSVFILFICGGFLFAQTNPAGAASAQNPASAGKTMPDYPLVQDDQLVFWPPLREEIPEGELGDAIRLGRDIFNNTQTYRGSYTFGDLSCRNCHLDEGRMPFSAPIWPAQTTLPDYRGKNWRINTLEDRIADCFTYSMNGQPFPSDSAEMKGLQAYISWLATGAPMYESDIYGRGYGDIEALEGDYDRGGKLYSERCAVCHGQDGQGQKVAGQTVFPPLWGDGSYNWGAGMSRVGTAAAFIKHNMPLGQPTTLSDQEAWDVALFMNSHERPQDPRYTGNAQETREKFFNFHELSMYGLEVNGKILGDHNNTGKKPFLRPDTLRFEPPGGE